MQGHFTPPRCPNRRCPMHLRPLPAFYIRRGSYQPRCRELPVQRFRCRACKRNFSRQTFRLDYRDKRPECNEQVLKLLVSATGLRQIGRVTRLSVHGVQYKFRKIARGMRQMNRNLLRRLPAKRFAFLLDEFETFEHSSILPLTVPTLIDRESFAILAVAVAPIRRVSKLGSPRRNWLMRHEREHGKRPDRSRACVRKVLGRLQRLLGNLPADMITDEKPLYAALLRRMFRGQVAQQTVSSRQPRTTYNPLFRINLTEEMLRDNVGRMRRRSWLVSKNQKQLRAHLEVYAAWRNWHRRRTNEDPEHRTPGVVIGLAERSFSYGEMLAWRQDWRDRSIYPTCTSGDRCVGLGNTRSSLA